MTGWVRNPESHRLMRIEPDPDLEPEPELKLELEEMAQERPLSEIFYPLGPLCHLASLYLTLDPM